TTGRPKGAELTHFNLSHNAETVGQRLLRLPEETTALAALPFFHSFGQTVIQNTVLMRGGTVVLMQRFDAVSALELIQGHGVTFFAGVPTMYFELLRHTTMSGLRLEGLTHLMSGGAPMPVEVMKEFERRHDAAILESYGLSETSPVASSNVPDRPRKAGSIGLPIEGIEFKLVDERGDSITDPMVPGEICIKGPNVMKGYYKRPESTAEAIQAGWLRTGDVAHRDEEGYYFIVDRKKDVILRGGFNVYPREVEEALYAHPAIAEAAVVGVRDERLGEEVKAVVALKTGASATEREIIEHCRGRLAAYKCPRIVEFRDSLPKGPTGKILKRVLRDEKG
ncbi:MAG TPA: AMP-binding protein, partial [Candidatus Polarisedimenticolia bacterium]|nr:AMP-binding protein [Candidatus Polarisedimenticolia bacterium]